MMYLMLRLASGLLGGVMVWGAIYYLILILRGNPTRDEPYKPMTPEEPPPPTPL
jgi:hypothetical protein